MNRCTDEYGNIGNNIVGKVVSNKLAKFTVKDAVQKGLDWYLIMDKDKYFDIIDINNPMKICVEQGNYMTLAICCYLVEE